VSNRLVEIGRVPLIPDPYTALRASQVFSSTREQAEKALALGTAFGGLLSGIRDGVRRFADGLERAMRIRDLSMMTDKSLADIGLRRDQLPQLYHASNFDAGPGRRPSARLNDSER